MIEDFTVSVAAQQRDFPVYRVDFWETTHGLEVESYRVQDAVDFHAVEQWARKKRPGQYVIYCEAPQSPAGFTYLRISGYEPRLPEDAVSEWVSNDVDARLIEEKLQNWRLLP